MAGKAKIVTNVEGNSEEKKTEGSTVAISENKETVIPEPQETEGKMDANSVFEVDDETVEDGESLGGSAGDELYSIDPSEVCTETVVICSNYPRDIKFVVPDNNGRPTDIIIKGNATYLRGKEKGILPTGAYGVTANVPATAWEWILKHRPDDAVIKNGLVFATTNRNARAAAQERVDLRHGFEAVDPKKTTSKRYDA